MISDGFNKSNSWERGFGFVGGSCDFLSFTLEVCVILSRLFQFLVFSSQVGDFSEYLGVGEEFTVFGSSS